MQTRRETLSTNPKPQKGLSVKRNSTSERKKETWFLFFFLGFIMLNAPFIHVFNKPVFLFGYPLMVLYLMIGWPVSILIVYIFSRKIDTSDNQRTERNDDGGPPEE